jgi:hypothetical protein
LITRSPHRQISRFAAAPRLRPLTLPVEHGGWGFLFEPIVIALLAAPSVAAVCLAGAAVAAFLARQPLKVALDDWLRRRSVSRTAWARAIAAAYLLTATLLLVAATRVSARPLWPLAIVVAPLAAITLWFDARGESRRLLPELAGAIALGAVAGAAGLADGWPGLLALSLWVSALVRVLPAIVTVRERVRRLHGETADIWTVANAHALAVVAAMVAVTAQAMPTAVPVIALYLALRAGWDLRPGAPPARAAAIGLRELVTGLVAAGAIGATWAVWQVRP